MLMPIFKSIKNNKPDILEYLLDKYEFTCNPFAYYIDVVYSINEFYYKYILDILFKYTVYIDDDILKTKIIDTSNILNKYQKEEKYIRNAYRLRIILSINIRSQ